MRTFETPYEFRKCRMGNVRTAGGTGKELLFTDFQSPGRCFVASRRQSKTERVCPLNRVGKKS